MNAPTKRPPRMFSRALLERVSLLACGVDERNFLFDLAAVLDQDARPAAHDLVIPTSLLGHVIASAASAAEDARDLIEGPGATPRDGWRHGYPAQLEHARNALVLAVEMLDALAATVPAALEGGAS